MQKYCLYDKLKSILKHLSEPLGIETETFSSLHEPHSPFWLRKPMTALICSHRTHAKCQHPIYCWLQNGKLLTKCNERLSQVSELWCKTIQVPQEYGIKTTRSRKKQNKLQRTMRDKKRKSFVFLRTKLPSLCAAIIAKKLSGKGT